MNWLARRVRRYLRLRRVRAGRRRYRPETWDMIRANRRSSASLKRLLREEGYFD